MQIDAPFLSDAAVQAVLAALDEPQTYFVGGCVRNLLLGAPVTDLDLSTVLRPDAVTERAERAGLKAVPTGIEHGTITVVAEGTPFEITTFRKDVETDGRRAVVAFADTIAEDAARRDFTMNALYLDAAGALLDPVHGLSDLEARHFRFIGDAQMRIKEDALRILRLFRFHAQYGVGDLNAEGLAACADNVDLLDGLSRERVGQEMMRLVVASGAADALAAMGRIGALARVLQGAELDFFAKGVAAVPMDADGAIFRLALLGAQNAGDDLRLSKAEQRKLATLFEYSSMDLSSAELGYRLGFETGAGAVVLRSVRQSKRLDSDWSDQVRFGASQVFPLSSSKLLNWFSGPDLGAALKRAEQNWIASDFTMTEEELIETVRPNG